MPICPPTDIDRYLDVWVCCLEGLLGWNYKYGVASTEMLTEALAMDQDNWGGHTRWESKKESLIQTSPNKQNKNSSFS